LTPYSQLRSLPRLELAQAVPLDKPLTLYVEVTNRCNLKCRMCPESHTDYAKIAGGIRTMNLDNLLMVAHRVIEIGGVKTMYLHSLGEPMLNPRTPDFIKAVRPHVERICLTTNGTVPMTKLLDCPPDYVRVSVYGNSHEEFRYVTQSEVDHRRVLDNVRDLWDARNGRAKLLGGPGPGYYLLPFIYVKGFSNFPLLMHRFGPYADEVDTEPVMNWNGEDNWQVVGRDADIPTSKRACPAPFYIMCIHADLRVSMCGVDWSKRLVVGDLHDQSLLEIWQGTDAHNVRVAHLAGERCKLDGCRTCTYLDTTLPDDIDALSEGEYLNRVRARSVAKAEETFTGVA